MWRKRISGALLTMVFVAFTLVPFAAVDRYTGGNVASWVDSGPFRTGGSAITWMGAVEASASSFLRYHAYDYAPMAVFVVAAVAFVFLMVRT